MLRSGLLVTALLASAAPVFAQAPPTAGGQLQQIPPPLAAPPTAPAIIFDRSKPPPKAPPSGPAVRVDQLRITGATLFTEAELVAATGFVPGRELTLPELRNLAAAISLFYNRRGYFLAQAYLPAQPIDGGTVTIAVMEGRYGAVSLRNESHLSDGVAGRTIAGLDAGDPIAIKPLERRLLLLSDIPGVAVRSTLAPGAEVGTSDLVIDLTPGRRLTGSLEADNAGNRYTGRYRLGGSLNLNNATGLGDQLSLRLLASTEGLAYGRAAWQVPVGDAIVGVSYTHLTYELGQEFQALDATGTADIASLYASYPLVRSRAFNLYALASIDGKWLTDEIGLVGQVSDKTSRAYTLGLRGDARDSLGGGGLTSFSLAWTGGDLDIENPAERAADALSARTQGDFGKLQFSATRLQTLGGPLSLYGAVRGQIANGNLDSSEKMALGGAYGVRAYPEGEAYGDQGYLATLEARLRLGGPAESPAGRFHLIAFIDAGQVDFAHDPWFPGNNRASRSGYGLGLTWAGPHDLFISASYARKLGDEPTTSGPDADGRAWIQITKLF